MRGCDVENILDGREGVVRLGLGNVDTVIIEPREFAETEW